MVIKLQTTDALTILVVGRLQVIITLPRYPMLLVHAYWYMPIGKLGTGLVTSLHC